MLPGLWPATSPTAATTLAAVGVPRRPMQEAVKREVQYYYWFGSGAALSHPLSSPVNQLPLSRARAPPAHASAPYACARLRAACQMCRLALAAVD